MGDISSFYSRPNGFIYDLVDMDETFRLGFISSLPQFIWD
jgi:hypothetical protein